MGASRPVTEAERHALLARDGLAAVSEWEAEHGRFTDAELAAARQRVAAEVAARDDHERR